MKKYRTEITWLCIFSSGCVCLLLDMFFNVPSMMFWIIGLGTGVFAVIYYGDNEE